MREIIGLHRGKSVDFAIILLSVANREKFREYVNTLSVVKLDTVRCQVISYTTNGFKYEDYVM